MPSEKYFNYLRKDRMTHVWCPGCGNGIVMKSFLEAANNLGLDKNKVAVVSGIGCSSRVTGYLDFNTMHTLHGRSIAFATGVKLARPDLDVIVMGGDGDMLAIGGNHFIHACRRNLDITVVIFNNSIYGMTGGQYSPTTPSDSLASTAPYGNIENQFDPVQLAIASGATYVARSTVYHFLQTAKFIEKGIKHKGISIIEVISNCHTYFGRYNSMPKPAQLHQYFKDNTISISKAKDMSKEELKGKIVMGEFINEDKAGYLEYYEKMRESVVNGGVK
ncbi:2-oxoacid:ferredoxin oxidoreductase subunit beta [Oceanotoga teriensis]|jgi:2-oxoglutarate ferredoxin oxidoreductase subunit beta|uniref:2-oxoacid:ferredoxin oxidoreductase subunit beta n=1 Tax=Oceanotoga teriensis TaxID=515440 RepID=UPI0027132E4B|nr:2-oxoacid:ferredoxin oxidoreductase subunit beta [Oceanotoga teriensis]MDO7977119.1 2-oxoacid:ferredoxin oxidoreductase subunit beta [Oceanotoga teriensis]